MRSTLRIDAVLLAVLAAFPVCAADAPGLTARVRMIAGLTPRLSSGQASEKGYIPRLEAIRALEKESPLSDAERAVLTAFLRSTDNVSDGQPEME